MQISQQIILPPSPQSATTFGFSV